MQDKPTRVKVLVFTVVSLLMATTAFAQCMAPREQRGDGFAKSHKYDQAISDYANALTCPELTTADKTRLNKKIQNCKALKEKERKEKENREKAARAARGNDNATADMQQDSTENHAISDEVADTGDDALDTLIGKEEIDPYQVLRELHEKWKKTAYMGSIRVNIEGQCSDGSKLLNEEMDYVVPKVFYSPLDPDSVHEVMLDVCILRKENIIIRKECPVEVKPVSGDFIIKDLIWSPEYEPGDYTFQIMYNGTPIYLGEFVVQQKKIKLIVNTVDAEYVDTMHRIMVNNRDTVLTFTVEANSPYTVTLPDWCMLRQKKGDMFEVEVLRNTAKDARIGAGSVTAASRNKNNFKTIKFNIRQAGTQYKFDVNNKTTTLSRIMKARGGNISLMAHTDAPSCRIEGASAWCSGAVTRDKYNLNLQIHVSTNKSARSRYHTLYAIVYDGVDKAIDSIPIAIRQRGNIPILESIFIPGAGLISKGRNGLGGVILFGEILTGGVAIANHFVCDHSRKNDKTNFFTRNEATIRASSLGACIGIYVLNLVLTPTLKAKENYNISFYPAVQPSMGQATLSLGFSCRF